MTALILGLSLQGALAEDCPDSAVLVHQAEEDIGNYQLASAEVELEKALQGWACGPIAEPELIARYFNARGMLLRVAGHPERAPAYFAAARGISIEAWNSNYGAEARAQWKAAAASGPGHLVVTGADGHKVAVDGGLVQAEVELAGGLHLVQVGALPGQASWAEVAEVRVGRFTAVDAGLQATRGLPPNQPAAPAGSEDTPHGSRDLLIAGVALGLGAGVAFVAADFGETAFMATADEDQARTYATAVMAGSAAGIALSAAAGGLVVAAAVKGQW